MARKLDIEHDFIPVGNPRKIPDVRAFQNLVQAHRRFPTEESRLRIAALRRVALSLAQQDLHADLFIGGSLNFTQSVEGSDVDIFCVATMNRGMNAQEITGRFRKGLCEELERDIRFDDKQALFIDLADLGFYLMQSFQTDLAALFPSNELLERSGVVKRYYHHHQVSLRIGTCGTGLTECIERLRLSDRRVERALARTSYLSKDVCGYHSSLEKYRERVGEHEDILALPRPIQRLHLLGLRRLRNEFFAALYQKDYLLQQA